MSTTTKQTEMEVQYELSRKMVSARNRLINAMRHVATDLLANATQLEKADSFPINSLGVLQSTGAQIDNLVGEFCALREALRLVQGRSQSEGPKLIHVKDLSLAAHRTILNKQATTDGS